MVWLIRIRRIRSTLTVAELATAAHPTVVRGVTDVTRQLLNAATVRCPVDTGLLRAQHSMLVRPGADKVVGAVEANTSYAEAVHDGTRRTVIRPRRRKALRFVVGGRVVFAAKVTKPPTRGRPWLADAARAVAATTGSTWIPTP